MYEEFSFEALVKRMLENVSDEFDKREGSVIYDAIAPAAMELAEFYISLDMVMNEIFAESASYYYLVKRAAERGMFPKEETCAVGKMVVTPATVKINAGERFNRDALNYSVVEPIEGEQGAYKVQCETPGIEGNQQTGTLLPIEYIDGLETAELTEILIPGEDDEDVETFRARYFASFGNEAYGGNKADYTAKVNKIDGVGGCKVFRSWKQGYSPASLSPGDAVAAWIGQQSSQTVGEEVYGWLQRVYAAAEQKLLTTGGTVKVLIISSEFKEPSAALIDAVQQALDPAGSAGEGDGVAPIGHVVNVAGVKNRVISIGFTITYDAGYTFAKLQESIEKIIDSYFWQLSQKWAESEKLVVRISQIEALLLGIEGIIDIEDTTLNGTAGNMALEADEIPVRGDVHG